MERHTAATNNMERHTAATTWSVTQQLGGSNGMERRTTAWWSIAQQHVSMETSATACSGGAKIS